VTATLEPLTDDDKETKRAAREARRAECDAGPMRPELRYRALLSILKMETDFLDLADRKARFALMIMSALNAVALVIVVRGGTALTAPGPWALAMRVELALYGAATLYYIRQAIESLRPRGKVDRSAAHLPREIAPGESMQVLFHADIAPRDRDEFRGLWQHLRLDNLTTELADQLHMVSRINVLKFAALGRLYQGVGVMTVLLTVLLLTAALSGSLAG